MSKKNWKYKFLSGIMMGVGTNTAAYALIEYFNHKPVDSASIILTVVFTVLAWLFWRME